MLSSSCVLRRWYRRTSLRRGDLSRVGWSWVQSTSSQLLICFLKWLNSENVAITVLRDGS
jgi:hypothetical protein